MKKIKVSSVMILSLFVAFVSSFTVMASKMDVDFSVTIPIRGDEYTEATGQTLTKSMGESKISIWIKNCNNSTGSSYAIIRRFEYNPLTNVYTPGNFVTSPYQFQYTLRDPFTLTITNVNDVVEGYPVRIYMKSASGQSGYTISGWWYVGG